MTRKYARIISRALYIFAHIQFSIWYQTYIMCIEGSRKCYAVMMVIIFGDELILCLIVSLLLFIQKIYPITWRFNFVRSRENNLCMYLMITVTLNTICVWHQVSSGICCVCLINLLSIKLLSCISNRLNGAYSQ